MKQKIRVIIENRDDSGVNVSSDDLPGLILSGKNRIAILASIETAARAILMRKGEDTSNLQIDAMFFTALGGTQ